MIEHLGEMGHELRRPEADYLRDGIHELRIRHGRVNYRLLDFFHLLIAAVISHGIVEEDRVPPKEIERAVERMREFAAHPDCHTQWGIVMNRKRTKTTKDAVEILHRRYVEGKPEMEAILEEERGKAEVARLVHDLRAEAGLTQKELADRVGTTPSVISRLEDADYGGHSLSMLRRIAAAVGQRVQIRFIPTESAGPLRIASRPGGQRLPDPPVPAQEVSAPVDLPRPGKSVRCEVREALHRLPDPYVPE